uniref:Uncharacterized protein n=1 Tax=Graphocephala atropunctata TaxID=36148 RepID=A0A1B6L4E6_9HEMI
MTPIQISKIMIKRENYMLLRTQVCTTLTGGIIVLLNTIVIILLTTIMFSSPDDKTTDGAKVCNSTGLESYRCVEIPSYYILEIIWSTNMITFGACMILVQILQKVMMARVMVVVAVLHMTVWLRRVVQGTTTDHPLLLGSCLVRTTAMMWAAVVLWAHASVLKLVHNMMTIDTPIQKIQLFQDHR